MQIKYIKGIGQAGLIVALPLFFILGLFVNLTGPAEAQEGGLAGASNLVANGNFESGFYQVPELGFEPPHVGNVPKGWNWYKNQAYGKYVIDSNQRFGINCASEVDNSVAIGEIQETTTETFSPFAPIPEYDPGPRFNSLALHMQSTDQQDARLGVYQTIDVVPGQAYRFSMSATIQVQAGAQTLEPPGPEGTPIPQAPNHTYELYFDQTGNTDWRAIPHEKWTNVTLPEQKLFFTVEETVKKGEEALAEIENYETILTAESDKLTIFITAWRKWANWRTAIFTLDCVALIPLNPAGYPGSAAAAVAPSPTDTPVAEVQTAAMVEQPAQPDPAPSVQPQADAAPLPSESTSTDTRTEAVPEQAETESPAAQAESAEAQAQIETAPVEPESETAPAEDTTTMIPASGGVLDGQDNTVLVLLVSLIVLAGLVGAGIWNMRR